VVPVLGVLVAAFAALQLLAEPAATLGTVGLALALVLLAVRVRIHSVRQWYPRITARDRLPAGGTTGDAFDLWTVNSWSTGGSGPLLRADVLEAALVDYDWWSSGEGIGEGGSSAYAGALDVQETKPVVRLRLRIHPEEGEPYETDGERRVPALCLGAVTAGRLVVRADPDGPDGPDAVAVDWRRSARLAGVNPYRVTGPDGVGIDLAGRPDLLLEQMRIIPGGAPDARTASPAVAGQLRQLARRAAAEPPAPDNGPGPESCRLVDRLKGERGEFGPASRRWVRRGGRLARARLLELRPTDTFQPRGPVLDTVLRIAPAAADPFVARKRMTVPLNYLALLHRTKDVVVRVNPGGNSFDVDWARTNLLAGATPATVIGPTGRQHALTGRPEPLWAVMQLLAAHGTGVHGPTLDLRRHPPALAAAVVRLIDPEVTGS
jgi:hypothetical protein